MKWLKFGETGLDNVQLSTHCFLLYVHTANDISDAHLTSLFQALQI